MKYLLLLIALNTTAASALDKFEFHSVGHERGNGGDVVVCRSAGQTTILSVELLDFYEARTMRGINRSLGAPELTVEEKINMALARLHYVSPKREARYLKHSQEFNDEALFLSGVTLSDINDSDHIAFPNNCSVEQIVIQKAPEFDEDKRYTVNADLWGHLDNDNRAGLILHEIIYREAVEYQIPNSVGSRYFNSLITSEHIQFNRRYDFFELLEKLEFLRTDYQDINLRLGHLDPSTGAYIPYPTALYFENDIPTLGVLEDKDAFFWRDLHFIPRGYTQIEFSRLGFPKSLTDWGRDGLTLVQVKEEDGAVRTLQKFQAQSVQFTADGQVASVDLFMNVGIWVQGKEVRFLGFFDADEGKFVGATFYPGLRLHTAYLDVATLLEWADGSSHTVQPGEIEFDEQGKVLRGTY